MSCSVEGIGDSVGKSGVGSMRTGNVVIEKFFYRIEITEYSTRMMISLRSKIDIFAAMIRTYDLLPLSRFR